MEFVVAYELLNENKREITKESISGLIKSINATIDDKLLDEFVSKIEGKTHDQIVSAGASKMTVQTGGSASTQAASASAGKAAAAVEEEVSSEEEVIEF